MTDGFFIMGAESEKVRGILMTDESISERDFEYKKEKVCSAITAGLIEIEQVEELVLVPLSEKEEIAA